MKRIVVFFCLSLKKKIIEIGEWTIFILKTFKTATSPLALSKTFLDQSYEIGIKSVGLVLITGMFTGMILSAQTFFQLGNKGIPNCVGFFVIKSMFTEIGPSLTAIVMAGRIGASITAFLGTMNVTEQISAMKTMGIDALRFFVFPRILAGMVCFPILSILSAWGGVLGGYVLCRGVFHLSDKIYWEMVYGQLGYIDIVLAFIKSSTFGFFITSLACFKGLKVSEGALEVGKETTKSVVLSYAVILFSNFVITLVFNTFFYS